MAEERLLVIGGLSNKEARERITEKWQKTWETANNSKWTRAIIPNIKMWINRNQKNYGETNYYITQFLTGHGSSATYLKKYGLKACDRCIFCEEEKDTPKHVFFDCPRFEIDRRIIFTGIGYITPQNLIAKMTASKSNWSKIAKFIEMIMKTKIEHENLIPDIIESEIEERK